MALDANITFSNLEALNAEFSEVQGQIPSDEWIEIEFNITASQSLTCFSSPVELLARPGNNKYYVYDGVMEYTYGTQPYSGGLFGIMDEDGKGFVGLTDTDFMANADANAQLKFNSQLSVGTIYGMSYLNKKIVFGCDPNSAVGNPSGGDGTFKIKMRYKINTFG